MYSVLTYDYTLFVYIAMQTVLWLHSDTNIIITQFACFTHLYVNIDTQKMQNCTYDNKYMPYQVMVLEPIEYIKYTAVIIVGI